MAFLDSSDQFPMSFMDLYKTLSNYIRLYVSSVDFDMATPIEQNEVYYFIFKNINLILQNMADHFSWSWAPFLNDYMRNLLLILLGSLLLSIGFCVWLLFQVSACYDYLNHVYGLMVGFSVSVIKNQRNFIRELSLIMESKVGIPHQIDEKRIRKRAKRSMQRSEENKKHDLGLKTTVRSLQEIKKPKAGMIVGMLGFLLLICGFNALVLLNMGIFSNSSQKILELGEYLQHAYVSIYATTFIRISCF